LLAEYLPLFPDYQILEDSDTNISTICANLSDARIDVIDGIIREAKSVEYQKIYKSVRNMSRELDLRTKEQLSNVSSSVGFSIAIIEMIINSEINDHTRSLLISCTLSLECTEMRSFIHT